LATPAGRLLSEVLNGTYSARVREDFRSGARGGVNGTPTFFINGVRYAGEFDAETLIAALLNSTEPTNNKNQPNEIK
jgi:protein-disulfide isomerase